MKKIAVKSIIFLIPVLIIYGFPLFVLLASDEFCNIDKVIDLQKDDSELTVLSLGYSQHNKYFKLKSAKARKSDILVLGSSRTMQFRSAAFKENFSFYNAGGSIYRTTDLTYFLNQLPRKDQPQLIIVGLDQEIFNQNRDISDGIQPESLFETRDGWLKILTLKFKTVWADYFKGKISIARICSDETNYLWGIRAKMTGRGFRNDGSQRYPNRIYGNPLYEEDKEPLIKDGLELMRQDRTAYRRGSELNQKAIDDLEVFLELCKERGIYVIGFLPPYASIIYDKMISMGNEYAYIPQIKPALAPLFDKYGFAFYDYSKLAWLGASDAEIIDSCHAAEKAYVRILLNITKTNTVSCEYIDVPFLQEKLSRSKGPYDVFGDQFRCSPKNSPLTTDVD